MAFVLGGGGDLGAHEVGMLRALSDFGITPDLVVGTSIGAINGAMIAADPSVRAVERLTELWTTLDRDGVFGDSIFSKVATLARSGTHLTSNTRLRELIERSLPVQTFEELQVPFECVAASIEQATVHYFSSGSLVDAILASSAVPGLLPPVEIDGEHFLDGGLVASIPLDRAIDLGATTIHVLQVGRIEEALKVPTKPWEVAMVAFEISRRHRFAESLRDLPDGIEVHVLPTGDPKSFNDLRQYRRSNTTSIGYRIEQSRIATSTYLTEHLSGQLSGHSAETPDD